MRNRLVKRDRLELRIVAQLAEQPVVEQFARVLRRIVAVHQPHARRHHAGRVVAVVDLLLLQDRSQLQQRADQQHARDDDLEHDEAARHQVDRAVRVAAAAVAQHGVAFARDDIQAGRSPETTAATSVARDRECQDESSTSNVIHDGGGFSRRWTVADSQSVDAYARRDADAAPMPATSRLSVSICRISRHARGAERRSDRRAPLHAASPARTACSSR